jgi:pimeloyl-ACP methyl ester carboxylesterase
MSRVASSLLLVLLLVCGLAYGGWRSGDVAPRDIVAETRAALGIELGSSRIETNGIRLHAVEAGPPDGEPVVLLHGFPEFWWTWHAQIGALARAGYRVTAPDLRGFGLSDKPPRIEDYRIEQRRADLLGLLDALGRESVFLAGHDFGGIVAWDLAIHHPERIRKLVVLNVAHPQVYREPPPGEPDGETIGWFRTFFQLPFLPELLARSGAWYLLERNLRATSRPGTFDGPTLRNYKQAWAQENAIHTMIHWYRASYRYPVDYRGTPRVRVPTLVVWGARDAFNDPRFAESSLAHCEDAKVVKLADAGHWLLHEQPAETSALLVEFFGEP